MAQNLALAFRADYWTLVYPKYVKIEESHEEAERGDAGATLPQSDRPYFRVLGPGLVTGAADDDPSGITAYSVAGGSPTLASTSAAQ